MKTYESPVVDIISFEEEIMSNVVTSIPGIEDGGDF